MSNFFSRECLSKCQLKDYSKDIESFGTGLQRIASACKDADVRVEFECSDLGFAVIFYRPINHINSEDNITDSVTEKDAYYNDNVGVDSSNVGEKFGENEGEFGENKIQTSILKIMCKNPTVSAKRIAGEIGLSARGVEKNIHELKKAGLLERVGPNKGGRWIVKLPNSQNENG